MSLSLPRQTSSLILRQFVPEDAAKVFAMRREAGIKKWIPDEVYESEQVASDVLRTGYAIEQKYQGNGYSRKVLEHCGFVVAKEGVGFLHDRQGVIKTYHKSPAG